MRVQRGFGGCTGPQRRGALAHIQSARGKRTERAAFLELTAELEAKLRASALVIEPQRGAVSPCVARERRDGVSARNLFFRNTERQSCFGSECEVHGRKRPTASAGLGIKCSTQRSGRERIVAVALRQ